MPTCGSITDGHIVAAVREGRLDEALLDEQVDRLLQFVFSTADAAGSGADYDRAQHHLFAQRAAEECAVLLKNDGGILPIRGQLAHRADADGHGGAVPAAVQHEYKGLCQGL